LKILRLMAENIKKLKVVSITPDGNVVQVTGPNGSGKTSVLDSIFFALGGAKEIPTQPIRRGQLKAHVIVELGEITVTRKFSKDTGTSLTVEAKNGARFPSPQKVLDEILGKLTFDPLEFSRMDPKKQLDQLRAMVNVDVDLDELDRLNASDFDKRTDINREIKRLDAQASGISFPDDTPAEEIDVEGLGRELQQVGAKNAELEAERRRRGDLDRKVEDLKREAQAKRAAIHDLRGQIKQLEERIAALERAADNLEIQAKGEHEAIAAMPAISSNVDTGEITSLITQANAINQAVTKKKLQLGLYAEAKKLRGQADELTEKMAARLNQKRTAIAAAKMPIEGLSFGEGEVVFNNLPFSQASSAEQLRISVAVAMAANPKLRVLRITDGSLLDEKSMELLSSMAELADYQVWIERVDTSGKVGVVMEDGEVKKP